MFYRCRLFLVFMLMLAVPAGLPVVTAAEAPRGDATIFIYHHFGDDRYPTTNVSMEQFREQMAYLAAHDYNVIPLAELVEMLRDGIPLPPRTVVITVDDGYRTTYTKAWPVFKEYDFPFTVFIYVEGLERRYSNYMTWDQVEEMAASGVDFQDHSYSHHRLADWPQGQSEEEYRRWIREDLRQGREILTRRLGEEPRFFAIPYGEYNHIVLEEAQKFGYEAIFTQDAGSVSDDTELFMISREPILGTNWSTLDHFQEVLQRVDLPFTDHIPGLQPLQENPPPRIGARLLYPERYRPGTFGIFVSELGWQPAKVDGDFVYIDNDTVLERRINRVMISAREKDTGRTALRFWMLTRPH
ncbi:polysaccharide deacetylase family protein [Desulfurivibrio dismutans]|uniref:polysaccharide deacetylase family protein n=1 Tax=Desulfurivibrio dismutans TaxID=1398908 RepID=UPI0023DCD5D3|nr:polysaccharide deacetylase family protein [Desulfurivibrio alkaliphilus]MDF1614879.1 polysaccharide deacetylase family protein [Desulfurivibrio alkaliphilus]